MSVEPEPERMVAYFAGRVQGVGFRFRTRDLAAGFAVTGFVENLRDGRVRLVAEGPGDELDRFLGELKSLMARNINEATQSREPATGEFPDFQIRL